MSETQTIAATRVAELRNDLKRWEKSFAEQNGGRKAGRDDIKANVDIAAKYKEYNSLRDIAAGKIPVKQTIPQSPNAARKRKSIDQPTHTTPSKRQAILASTPQSRRLLGRTSASQNGTPSSAIPMPKLSFVGPTPQRDGKMLGIFDMMSAETPSSRRTALVDVSLNIVQTPSKTRSKVSNTPEEDSVKFGGRGSRTPMSSSKRFMLDMFATPQKVEQHAAETTPSTAKAFATPAFLRRHTAPSALFDGQAPASPETIVPWKRRSLGRSLSSMLEEARKREEHAFDDDLDALREIEDGGPAPSASRRRSAAANLGSSSQLFEDIPETQYEQDVPSDIEAQEDGEEGEQKESTEPPRKPWKKKGLKRQTKRVIMRPVLKKAPKTGQVELDAAESGDEDASSASEDEDTTSKASTEAKADAGKKRTYNHNAPQNSNFRRLKIKNKNSKAKGRGRYGRR